MTCTDEYGVLSEDYEDNSINENEICLPIFIKDHPKVCHSIKEREEEYKFFCEVIRDITDNEYFEELSNEDGSETLDHLGEFCIWYKTEKGVKLEKIITYKDVTKSGIGTGGLKHMIEYLVRYYNMFKGKVIQLIYTQENSIMWSYKDNEYSKFDISTGNNYYSWV